MNSVAFLPDRAVIAVEGDDRVAFLQGLVSNDVQAAQPGHAVWAALLSPQGKWLADFFVFSDGNRLLLDCEREQQAMLLQRLGRFRLRMKVSLCDEPGLRVYVAWPAGTDIGGLTAADPRLPNFATRSLSAQALAETAGAEEWDLYRLEAGLPDGSRDMEADRSVLLEAGFDELSGVSWSKGCYMGQELTARTKYRGLVKRRLVPVSAEGPLPAPGTLIMRDGQDVGTMRSGRGNIGLASLRLDALDAALTCGETKLTPRIPGWIRLPETIAR